MAAIRVSIVIPCRDEAAVVPSLVAALDPVVRELGAAEVIAVDDGSVDPTWARLREAAAERPWLRLVRLRRGFGQTAALAAGFDRARGEVIVAMDADLQNDPADIPRLVGRLNEGWDVVSGWRRRRHDHLVIRRLPSWLANRLIARVSGMALHDIGCTLKAYRREVLAPVRLYGEMHRFIPIYCKAAGARVTEIEVSHRAREHGRSKYRLGRTPKVLLDLIAVKLLTDYAARPLHLFGRWGLRLALLGLLGAAAALIGEIAVGPTRVGIPLLLACGVAGLAGVQLIGLGLLAELQVRTWHESQGRPPYLVAEEAGDLSARSSGSTSPPGAGAAPSPGPGR